MTGEAIDKQIHSFDQVLLGRMDQLMIHFLEESATDLTEYFVSNILWKETLAKVDIENFVSLAVRQQQYGYLWGRVWTGTAFQPVLYSTGITDNDRLNSIYRSLLEHLKLEPKDSISTLPLPIREILVCASASQLSDPSAVAIHQGNANAISYMLVFLLQLGAEGVWKAKLEHEFAVSQGSITDSSEIATMDFWRAIVRNDYDAARRALQRTLTINPYDHTAWDMMGNVEFQAGNTEKAFEAYDRAIQLSPDYAHTYYDRGSVYLHLEEYEKAVRDLETAVKLDPNYCDFRVALGAALNQIGRCEEAIVHLKQAIYLDPASTVSRFYLGVAYRTLGRITESDQQFRWILSNAPDSFEAQELRKAGFNY